MQLRRIFASIAIPLALLSVFAGEASCLQPATAAPAPTLPAPAPIPTPEEIEAFYSYDQSAPLQATMIAGNSNLWYREYEVSYQSDGDTVYARYYVPHSADNAPVPVMVGIHGMFSDSEYQFWSIADFAAKRGIAVLTPSLPYHHRRTVGFPLIPGQQLIVGQPDAVRDNIRRAVIDCRRAVDWLSARPEVNQNAISIAGVSLGGIVASIAFKMEPRFANGMFAVAGSGVAGILQNGDTELLRIFRAAASLHLLDVSAFSDALQIVDPANVPDLHPRPALLFNGTSDLIMSSADAQRLRRSLARAEQIWTDGGHYFPVWPAEYLFTAYIARAATSVTYLDAGEGYRFEEAAGLPDLGANRLSVDLRAELGQPLCTAFHALSVPLMNRTLPVVVASRATYDELRESLLSLPAFIYVIESDNCAELSAALHYTAALGLFADPLLYYVAPSQPGGYSVSSFTAMQAEAARLTLADTLKASRAVRASGSAGVQGSQASRGILAPACLQVPVPNGLSPTVSLFAGLGAQSAVGRFLAASIPAERLHAIPWFPDYPLDGAKWSSGPSVESQPSEASEASEAQRSPVHAQ
ncbi:MAG: hypothetical protein VB144_03430 [Clostridia bacterium]|nr:hypothetical protein [Clostridia bacterium]